VPDRRGTGGSRLCALAYNIVVTLRVGVKPNEVVAGTARG